MYGHTHVYLTPCSPLVWGSLRLAPIKLEISSQYLIQSRWLSGQSNIVEELVNRKWHHQKMNGQNCTTKLRGKTHTMWKDGSTNLTVWLASYIQMAPGSIEKLHCRDYSLDEYTILPHTWTNICLWTLQESGFIQSVIIPNLFGDRHTASLAKLTKWDILKSSETPITSAYSF